MHCKLKQIPKRSENFLCVVVDEEIVLEMTVAC